MTLHNYRPRRQISFRYTSDGSSVVIGLEQGDDLIIGRGTREVDADGNLVFTSENLVSHTKSVTVLSADGQTVISEQRFGEDGSSLTEQ